MKKVSVTTLFLLSFCGQPDGTPITELHAIQLTPSPFSSPGVLKPAPGSTAHKLITQFRKVSRGRTYGPGNDCSATPRRAFLQIGLNSITTQFDRDPKNFVSCNNVPLKPGDMVLTHRNGGRHHWHMVTATIAGAKDPSKRSWLKQTIGVADMSSDFHGFWEGPIQQRNWSGRSFISCARHKVLAVEWKLEERLITSK